MSRCPEGRGCIFCGPRVGARHRDRKRAPHISEYEDDDEPELRHSRLCVTLSINQWERLAKYDLTKQHHPT